MDSYWIGKVYGKDGLSTIGSVFVLNNCIYCFTIFLTISTISHIAAISQQESHEATFLDVIRFCIMFSILVPLIFLPLTPFYCIWMNSKYKENSFLYMIPLASCYFVTALYRIGVSILQANGYSILNGFCYCLFSILTTLVFEPIFLVVLKTKIWGASLSIILSESICLILIYFFLKKYSLFNFDFKITIKSFFTTKTNNFGTFLKTGFSAFITQLGLTIPTILIQKYLSKTSSVINQTHNIMASWNILAKVFKIINEIPTAFIFAFIPAASYSFSSKLFKRLFQLTILTFGFCLLWTSIGSLIFSLIPTKICWIWTNDKELLDWLGILIPPSVYTASLVVFRTVLCAFFQSTKKGNMASILNLITQLIGLSVISTIVYKHNQNNPTQIIWSYVYCDSFSALLSLCFMCIPYKLIKNNWNDYNLNSLSLINEDQTNH